MPVLTLLDILSIQGYVFATNRLKDAVGGSALVERLAEWVKSECSAGRVLMAAGGNALVVFDNIKEAQQAVGRLSRSVLDEAPGLEFGVVHLPYEESTLAQAMLDIHQKVQQAKLTRRPSVPLLGLSVTASCSETRLPATDFDEDGRPVAAGVNLRRRDEHRDRWNRLLPKGYKQFRLEGGPELCLQFPVELDHLGRSRDDRSLMGLVHMDGNRIGGKIANWLAARVNEGTVEDELKKRYRNMSEQLAELAENAFRKVVDRVVDAIRYDAEKGYEVASLYLQQSFPLHVPDRGPEAGKVLHLPVRPLILGGDDLTFVCDGRLALDLAATALTAFADGDVPELGAVRACAGVAVTRTHAPILRVYDRAEELCREAKRKVRDDKNASALDWHLGFTSPTESLNDLRKRQYQLRGDEMGKKQYRLTCRPYPLGSVREEKTWRWLAEAVLGRADGDGFHGPAWAERRSKIKALRQLAREGPDAVRDALNAWRVTVDRHLKLPGGIADNGYFGESTSLLDAIELLDIHMPLEVPNHARA